MTHSFVSIIEQIELPDTTHHPAWLISSSICDIIGSSDLKIFENLTWNFS